MASQAPTPRPIDGPFYDEADELIVPIKLPGRDGKIDPNSEIGKGGEGWVYAVQGRNDLVVKIWHFGKEPTDADEKIRYMVANPVEPDPSATWQVIWPVQPVRHEGVIVGYTMRRLDSKQWTQPIHYYNPSVAGSTERQQGRELRTDNRQRMAFRLALAFKALHDAGYVIGDVNPKNFLINRTDEVAILDCDSLGFTTRDRKTFSNNLGMPDFQAPEQQGKQDNRTPNNDCFGLAVLIFLLFNNGNHPYNGTDPCYSELGDRIANWRFPRSASSNATTTEPQDKAWNELSDDLRRLFLRCFDRKDSQRLGRPTVDEWVAALSPNPTAVSAPSPSRTDPWQRRWLITLVVLIPLLAAGIWMITGGTGPNGSATAQSAPVAVPVVLPSPTPTTTPTIAPTDIPAPAPTPIIIVVTPPAPETTVVPTGRPPPMQQTLTLTDFATTGLTVQMLALFAAGNAGDQPALYSAAGSKWLESGSLVEGETDIGPDGTAIVRITYLEDGNTLRLNDSAALALKDYFGADGEGNDLMVWVQTAEGSIHFPVVSNVKSSGGNFINFNLPPEGNAIVGGINPGERFILALTKPVSTTTASVALPTRVRSAVSTSEPTHTPVPSATLPPTPTATLPPSTPTLTPAERLYPNPTHSVVKDLEKGKRVSLQGCYLGNLPSSRKFRLASWDAWVPSLYGKQLKFVKIIVNSKEAIPLEPGWCYEARVVKHVDSPDEYVCLDQDATHPQQFPCENARDREMIPTFILYPDSTDDPEDFSDNFFSIAAPPGG